MRWRLTGHAKVSQIDPKAWGTCDRCGFNFNLHELQQQMQWAGPAMVRKSSRVCSRCMDRPSEHMRTVDRGPDPLPIHNARPEPYTLDETDFRIDESGIQRVTESDIKRVKDDDI